MHCQIIATAPISRIKALTLLTGRRPNIINPDNSLTFTWDYFSKREALQWMRHQAECLAFNSIELLEFFDEIKKHSTLTVDGVTARIQRNK
jgi:hypothetical protein